MNILVKRVLLHALVLAVVGACSPKTNETITEDDISGCICSPGEEEGRTQLENGIRGQVKFVGEEEAFASIPSRMAELGIPALSLAVIREGEIAWADVYQNPNFADAQELDCASIFQAASLSKPVTFMAALRMQAAGEIDLDQDIGSYLTDYALPPGAQSAENPVTLRNIFAHTSGINPGGYQGYARDLPMPSDLDVLMGNEGVNTAAIEVVNPPNEVLAYSGGAYTLAELALQDYYDDEFANIMRKWLLEPAGMSHSEFTQPLPVEDANRVAKGYSFAGELIEGGWHNHPEQAAAGLWSKAPDMAKFLIEIYKGYQGKSSIFSTSDIKAMLAHERDGHIYGFMVDHQDDDISITHYGGNVGYRSGMTISLTTGNGLVYLTNSDNGGGLGNELLLTGSAVYGWSHFKQTEEQRRVVDGAVLKSMAGAYTWNNQIDLSLQYDKSSNQLSLFFPNGDEYKLVPIESEGLDFIHANTGVQVSYLAQEQAFTLYGQKATRVVAEANPE